MFKPLFKTNIMRWACLICDWRLSTLCNSSDTEPFILVWWAKHMVKGGPWYTCHFEVCSVHIIAPGLGKSMKPRCPLFFNFLFMNLMSVPYDWQLNFSHLSGILGSQICLFFKGINNGYLRKMTPVIEFLDRQANHMSEGLFNPRFQGFWRQHSPLNLSW